MSKEMSTPSRENSIASSDSSLTCSSSTSSSSDPIPGDKENPKVEEEKGPESDTELAAHAKKYPHLQKTFDKIDAFLKEIRVNPTFKGGRFASAYSLSQFMFMEFKDVDKIAIGEYMSLTDAAELIKNSYETLLKELGVPSLGSLPVSDIENGGSLIQKLIAIRDIICSNITRNRFAMNACRSGMMNHFVEDLKVMKVEDCTDKSGGQDPFANKGKLSFDKNDIMVIGFLHFCEEGEPVEIFDSVTVTLHNCARFPGTKNLLREIDTVKYLLPFLKVTSKSGKLSTLVTLSKLVDETENEYILTDESLFEVIFEIFEVAWKHSNHYGFRWSVGALMNGMAHLAKNDSNKTVLYEKGAVSVLMKVLKDGWANEKEDAVKCVWELAFDKKIKTELAKDDELINLLKELKSSPEQPIRQAAKGALWEIQQEERAKTPAVDGRSGSQIQGGHVMISYQWDDQKILKKIKDSLTEHGYKVWMDIDSMAGSTLEAMAKAVEEASVVLVCMSEKYKLSQNCRSEAGYAFSTKKDIIPLIMQRGYIPDGWLGILRESKLFFDFSGKYAYNNKLEDLLRELGQRGRLHPGGGTGGVATVSVNQAVSQEMTRGQRLATWSEKDVHNWLTKIGLQNKPSLEDLSTENLFFLRDLSRNAPEFFYNYLKNDLDLKSLNELTTFCRALDKL